MYYNVPISKADEEQIGVIMIQLFIEFNSLIANKISLQLHQNCNKRECITLYV